MPRLPLLLAAAVIAGAAAPAAGSVQALMKSVVDPAANVLFAVGGEADPANDPPPKLADARWTEGAEAARKVKAVAMRMREKPLVRDETDWKAFVAQMETAAAAAQAAGLAHDGAKLSQAANDLSDSCSACHAKYKPQGG